MKTQLFKKTHFNIPLIMAVFCLLIFASLRQPNENDTELAAKNCCKGYTVSMEKLKRFMVDSLGTGSFEGGIYSKADLLRAINSTSGDSVYIMNALINCLATKGNGMFITSPATGEVKVVSRNPYCAPCPGKACCPQNICITQINRSCISYTRLITAESVAVNK